MGPIFGLVSVLVLGVGAQWLAWRLKLPSILLLLVFGMVAGSGFGLDPDALLGDLLFPFVSLSVAVILFEGGLTLRFSEFPHVGAVVMRLITTGVLLTGVVATLGARWLIGLDWELALLTGAILTVTGPTVVGPLLRHVRPAGTVGPVLNWESILVDPVGAVLAVLVYQAIRQGRMHEAPMLMLAGVGTALAVGVLVGLLGALLMVVALRRHWVPDHLQNAFALTMVLTASVVSNQLHHESGLLTVTLMGIALANQRWFPVRHIVEFKENLRVLLIAALFILLAARVPFDQLAALTWGSAGFVLLLVLVARPLAVWTSTFGTDLTVQARVFMAWMAPRGIVAASVASIFSLDLVRELEYQQAARLVPIVFLVIVGTVTIYGLTAAPLARRLGLAQKDPQGALLLGAHPFSIALGKVLQGEGFPVLVVDSNFRKVTLARMDGLPVWHGNILADYAVEEMRLGGLGRLLALTPNDEANALATVHLRELFSRTETYQLPPESPKQGSDAPATPIDLRGRLLFGPGLTHRVLNEWVENGWVIKTTPLTARFDFAAFRAQYGGDAVPLFVITETRRLLPFTIEDPPQPTHGRILVSLAPPQTTPQVAEEVAAVVMRASEDGKQGT